MITRSIVLASGIGMILGGCTTGVAKPTEIQRLQHEKDACKLFGTPPPLPKPNPAKFFTIGVKTSLITALSNSDFPQLEVVESELSAAARKESRTANGVPVVRALDKGVEVCHRLGLSTTSQ
jgi:hypothetical protein